MELNNEVRKAIYDFACKVGEQLTGFRDPNAESFSFTEATTEANALRVSKLSSFIPTASHTAGESVSAKTVQAYRSPAEAAVPNATAQPAETVIKRPSLSDNERWTLSQVAYDVSNCTRCALHRARTKPVFGEGCGVLASQAPTEVPARPLVMVIGEGPGHDEDVTGRPFVGRAGQLLDKMLSAIGLSRNTNCYICNVVKCRPPNNREPAPDEIGACIPYLHKQIEILQPAYILLMGRTACHALLDTSEGINRLHGKFFTVSGIPALCTYHPSALLRNEALKRPAWEDLKRFRDRIAETEQL